MHKLSQCKKIVIKRIRTTADLTTADPTVDPTADPTADPTVFCPIS